MRLSYAQSGELVRSTKTSKNRFFNNLSSLSLGYNFITMKDKEFDYFSFKAPSSKRSESEASLTDILPHPSKHLQPNQINYRHTHNLPKMDLFDRNINEKISNISNQLEQNIKRRLELQQRLENVVKAQKNRQERKIFNAYSSNTYKEPNEVAKQFRKIEQRADKITQLTMKRSEYEPEQLRLRELQRSKEILLSDYEPIPTTNKEKILIPIMQSLAAKEVKPIPVYTVPDQIKIQKLLRKATFPQVPNGNLEALRKQVEQLFAVHQPHSDIHYMLMVVYYHQQKYLKVRKHFEQIIMFKNFNKKAYWISAESEFCLQNFDLCLKMTEECMNKLQDKYLPRFIYLKAKCYDEIGNYINSIVCYNQLIKIKPKISQYYLHRGILYHRIGYYRQAKEDFTMFGVCNPDAQQIIKEKILTQKNEVRRKEYIAMLAKMY